MIYKLIFIFIIIFFLNKQVLSSENDCNQFKKLSAKYIECNAKKLKEKSTKKFEKSGIKNKLKKFKDSKTLTDLVKD